MIKLNEMRAQLGDRLRHFSVAGDTGTALGFVLVALAAVAIAFAVEIAIHSL